MFTVNLTMKTPERVTAETFNFKVNVSLHIVTFSAAKLC